MYFNDLFKLVTLDTVASAGAQLVASEIATRNEVRQLIGFKPAEEQLADQLMNPNINPQTGEPLEEEAPLPEEGAVPEDATEEDEAAVPLGEMKVADILGRS
jgi:hypothetical protein